MGDVINFCKLRALINEESCNSEPIAIINHLVCLDDDLMPITEGDPSRKWFGVVEMGFFMEFETTSFTLLAAFLKKDHAESFATSLSPNFGGYLKQDIILTIQNELRD